MDAKSLSETAREVVSKTILAADESTRTIKKRLAAIGLESTPEINRKYRQLLFTSPGIEDYISGVILYDETIRQSTDDDTPFSALLASKGIVPGIKVDGGTAPLPNHAPETFTQGLEGLDKRLIEYRGLGARFAKWRAVYIIDSESPSPAALEKNAQDLAVYAKLCQDAGIVPIVEPEVLMNGTHSIETNQITTAKVLASVFNALKTHGVLLDGIILKPNMITAGIDSDNQASTQQVAQKTLDVLAKEVPPTVFGIAFLSGGQSPDLATQNLLEINKLKNNNIESYPWRLTASYGRALQSEAIAAWGGKPENIKRSQEAFISRARKVYQASLGQV